MPGDLRCTPWAAETDTRAARNTAKKTNLPISSPVRNVVAFPIVVYLLCGEMLKRLRLKHVEVNTPRVMKLVRDGQFDT